MTRGDRRNLASLFRAHRLGWRERRICRRAARRARLDGSEGPLSSPAAVFFSPRHLEAEWRAARAGRSPFRPEEVGALAAKLFAAPQTAVEPPPAAAGALPRDW